MEGSIIKTRKQKTQIYEKLYEGIPRDFNERIQYMYDQYHISDTKMVNILNIRDNMMNTLAFSKEILVILYEEPEGSPRPRARYINKSNLSRAAKEYPGYIQVYSLTGNADRTFMKRLIENNELDEVGEQLIYTPITVTYDAFIKTPNTFNVTDKMLAEFGYIRPIPKPDFDNIAKKYSDMYNGNVWIDDSLVISGTVNKYYSILPRIEIRMRYLNMLYNKYQYKSMKDREDLQGVDIKYFDSSSL